MPNNQKFNTCHQSPTKTFRYAQLDGTPILSVRPSIIPALKVKATHATSIQKDQLQPEQKVKNRDVDDKTLQPSVSFT
jgi:hypothetical protein